MKSEQLKSILDDLEDKKISKHQAHTLIMLDVNSTVRASKNIPSWITFEVEQQLIEILDRDESNNIPGEGNNKFHCVKFLRMHKENTQQFDAYFGLKQCMNFVDKLISDRVKFTKE